MTCNECKKDLKFILPGLWFCDGCCECLGDSDAIRGSYRQDHSPIPDPIEIDVKVSSQAFNWTDDRLDSFI